jgi:alanyl-tRNA synthetase
MLSCYISKELVAKKNLNASQVVRELGKTHTRWWRRTAVFALVEVKSDGIPEALSKAMTYAVVLNFLIKGIDFIFYKMYIPHC